MVKILRLFVIVGLMMGVSSITMAWNAIGHRLIAQIAYDHLTPKAKKRCAFYNHALTRKNKRGLISQSFTGRINTAFLPKNELMPLYVFKKRLSFVNLAVWLDFLYAKDFVNLKPMHYIDIPFTEDNTPLPNLKSINAVWAMRLAKNILADPHSTLVDKSLAFRIALHVTGDLHQPLHAATRVSMNLPKGDRGGNDVKLQSNLIARNLHSYWDKGGGSLSNWQSTKPVAIRAVAREIEQRKPCMSNTLIQDPIFWAKESHDLAVRVAYGKLAKDNNPNSAYQAQVQVITEERIALAGCRLAEWLNQSVEESQG